MVRKYYNPDRSARTDQGKDLGIVIHSSENGCCGENPTPCAYDLDTDFTTYPTGVVIVDATAETPVETQYNFASTPTSPKELRQAVAIALKCAGFDPYCDDDGWKPISTSTKLGRFRVIGEATITNFVVAGALVPVTAKCSLEVVCQLLIPINVDTEVGLLSVDGSTGTAIGTEAGFPAGDAAAVTAAVIAALDAEGITYDTVCVDELPGKTGGYEAKVDVIGGCDGICIGDQIVSVCTTFPTWVETPPAAVVDTPVYDILDKADEPKFKKVSTASPAAAVAAKKK